MVCCEKSIKTGVLSEVHIIIIFIKSYQKATYTQSIRVCTRIITEELVAFVNKLSVVASCSEIVVINF